MKSEENILAQRSWTVRFWDLCSVPRLHTRRSNYLYRLSKFLDCINKQQPIFSTLVALNFIMYNFALIFYITIVKINISRLICCGFLVVSLRSEGWTINLSLHFCLVTPRYIRQLLKRPHHVIHKPFHSTCCFVGRHC